MDYTKHFQTRIESQKTPIREDQVPNSEGGWVWPVSDWKRLHRFLILGSEAKTTPAFDATRWLVGAGTRTEAAAFTGHGLTPMARKR